MEKDEKIAFSVDGMSMELSNESLLENELVKNFLLVMLNKGKENSIKKDIGNSSYSNDTLLNSAQKDIVGGWSILASNIGVDVSRLDEIFDMRSGERKLTKLHYSGSTAEKHRTIARLLLIAGESLGLGDEVKGRDLLPEMRKLGLKSLQNMAANLKADEKIISTTSGYRLTRPGKEHVYQQIRNWLE